MYKCHHCKITRFKKTFIPVQQALWSPHSEKILDDFEKY